MQQINNNFASCYYLTREGTVFNSSTNKTIKADSSHMFKLKTEQGAYKKISLKELYKKVYNEPYCIDDIPNLENEEWKPVERTENVYWISDKGRVKSLAGYKAIILKPNYINGYERVDIVQDGSRSSKLISRLVAAAFLLQPAAIDMQLHHKNGQRSCNTKENLEWLTPQQHKAAHKKMKEQENGNEH